jgi:hypothetical protein
LTIKREIDTRFHNWPARSYLAATLSRVSEPLFVAIIAARQLVVL